ncbi:MAG: TonB-dependent receptor, partial [Myxococcota bacterium]
DEADEVRVLSVGSVEDTMERSAEAVDVLDGEDARTKSADLGEVLARGRGIGVRRGGGLGSSTRLSLGGLTGAQVRTYVDGVPLEFSGYAFGLGNIPVNAVDRIEIYRGVVPPRFGGDALGGAINVVSARHRSGTHASASYQAGSFDTHRATVGASSVLEPYGVFLGVSGFVDSARNDYLVDVEAPDETGQLRPATVRRFHDAYRAGGGSLEAGFVDRPWARVLVARGFFVASRKELQHNVVMSLPYGEVQSRQRSPGGTLTYEHTVGPGVDLEIVTGYTRRRIAFEDTGRCRYDWFGQCAVERPGGGEVGTVPTDTRTTQDGGFARIRAAWDPAEDHQLAVSVAPTGYRRTGRELEIPDGGFDPLRARRDLFSLVTGLSWRVRAAEDRVENTVFVKDYVQRVFGEEPLLTGTFDDASSTSHSAGVGDGLRVDVGRRAYLKASYEWATRLPGPDEVFGDAVLVLDNLDLRPERSHNANVGGAVSSPPTVAGTFSAQAFAFARFARELIVLLGNDRSFAYQNVFSARSLGGEGEIRWEAPRNLAHVELNASGQDFRNASGSGPFAAFRRDRIPNRPWLFANGQAGLRFAGVIHSSDALSLDWVTRYVHTFFRGWESVGAPALKQRVPVQVIHGASVSYGAAVADGRIDASVEVANVLDADAFDFFGVQRPGRAVFGKLTLEM